VIDYEGLTRRACGCNDQVRAHFDDVLAGVYPDPVPEGSWSHPSPGVLPS
jgi:hypothetical protein